MGDFEIWWKNEGSVPPKDGSDLEEHVKRMCSIAWSNSAFKLQAKEQELEAITDNYNELIMAVEYKYENETRHETALRQIKSNVSGVGSEAPNNGDQK
jgi:hypothetical protein